MAIPKLNIPISADMAAFRKAIDESTARTSQLARHVAKTMQEMTQRAGTSVAAAMAQTYGGMALGIASKVAIAIGAFKLMADAVETVRQQLQAMIEIGEKASNVGVSPEFYQGFINGARGAEERVKSFEDALGRAYQELKPVLNPDWTVWDQGLKKVTAIETTMREMRELFGEGQASSGLTQFRNATDNEGRIIATLTFMKQLQAIGQDVAAYDLGDKLFGSRFTDQIRLGKITIDELIEAVRTKTPDMFSNNAVIRAKELDEELKAAWRTVDQNLHPAWNALDLVALKIKSTWVDIVKIIAEAVKLIPGIPTSATGGNELAQQRYEASRLELRLQDKGLTQTQKNGIEDRLRAAQARIAQIEASIVPMAPINFEYGGTESVPLPRPRPDSAPPPPPPSPASARDRFETSADAIEKRTAAIDAETKTLDVNVAARERARIVAQLQTTAMQINAEAGRGANIITEQQARRINEVAQAYENAAQHMEKARLSGEINFAGGAGFLSQADLAIAYRLRNVYGDDIPQAMASTEAAALRVNDAMRDLSSSIENDLSTGLNELISGAKSSKEAFSDLSRSIIADLQRMLIKSMVVQPMMRFVNSSLGSIGGGALSLPQFDDGGYVTGPGTGTSDSIPARLSNGEFVVNARSTQQFRHLLEAINSGTLLSRGGAVGRSSSGSLGIGGVVVNVHNAPAGTTADVQQSRGDDGSAIIDVVLRAVDNRMIEAARDRGHPFNRSMAQTFGINTARTLG